MPPAFIERIIAGRTTAQERAQEALPLAEHGGDRRGEAGQGAVGTLKRGSTDAAYLARRIARDRPDVLERMRAGERPTLKDWPGEPRTAAEMTTSTGSG